MPGDYLPDDLKNLWQELETKPVQLSPERVRREREMLGKGIRRRSILGIGVCLFLMAAWTFFFFIFPNVLQRIGSILTVAGVGYMALQLRMCRARTAIDTGETDCATFYRDELARQRDFHRGKWLWSRLLTFMPGPMIWILGFAQAFPRLATGIHLELEAFLVLPIVAVLLNLRLARKYQRRIDALDQSQRNG